MTTVSGTEVQNNLAVLWREAENGPVTVLSAGQPVAAALSPAEFEKLTVQRRGIETGFAKHLFPGVDMDALLGTNIDDVFEGQKKSLS